MSEPRMAPDQAERDRALEVSRSFIVQAPAGSGKTELLIQRYLALLACVDRPEEIAAITFTIKAAAQMRQRVLAALHAARVSPRPSSPQEARTWDLARAALERDQSRGWNLEESADRLKVQTIDALCASLTRQMPVLSRFGGQPEVIEDATALFAEAARNLLASLDGHSPEEAAHVERLLLHLDNDTAEATELIAEMLRKRDQWLRTLKRNTDRASLEAALDEVRRATVEEMLAAWPTGVPVPQLTIDEWIARAGVWTIQSGAWRKDGGAPMELRTDALLERLRRVKALPPAAYSDDQWEALEAMIALAPLAIRELQLVFARHGKADFTEFALRALQALDGADGPTDLLLVLDYRIRHILVDEFQDTSHTQYRLLELLTSGWEPGDGRTLFLVGDPMQSIYRFREAEVGLFLQAREQGIGGVWLDPVTLTANFRSQAGIVDWVNETFARVMPGAGDVRTGAVAYSPSRAIHAGEAQAVQVHDFYDNDLAGQARRVAEVAREALRMPGRDGAAPSVAILVRNRRNLAEVIPLLRDANVAYRAVEIEALDRRPAVRDLLALTRAIAHPADRAAWLAVLRAPWCGLTLADLLVLAPGDEPLTLWQAMNDAPRVERLSADGRARLQRVRGILAPMLERRGRGSLRDLVEGAWLALGGPACIEGGTAIEEAGTYLDYLEANESSGSLEDLTAFEASLAKLFAPPDLASPECVQVMTIHKAKGLEFDTVIVPSLASGSGHDSPALFLWMETAEQALLLAPIQAAGGDKDAIYELVRRLDRTKADHEAGRLLYVAATRARSRLHLMGDASHDRDGALKPPSQGTLLAKLWPAVAPLFRDEAVPRHRQGGAGRTVPAAEQARLRRLDLDRYRVDVPPAVEWIAPPDPEAGQPIEFSWVGDTARRVGSVVHRWLQRIAEEEARGWNRASVEKQRPAIRHELASRGVVESEIDDATSRVVAALTGALEDPRGKWLLGPQANARNEYRISVRAEGVERDLVIDRMFEDLAGPWIVDYKTSTHEGANLERFLSDEESRYRPQLDRYARALGSPGAMRGLYFPLLKGWREWTSDE